MTASSGQRDLESVLEWIRGRHFGKYRGVVVDAGDDTARGRLKVRVPAVLRDLAVWALPCVPYAGDQVGLYALPPVGSGVWVEFEGGDPSFPIWTGAFWADDQLPDESDAELKVLRTGSVTVRIDDSGSELRIQVQDGAQITLTGSDLVAEKDDGKVTVSGSSVELSVGGSSKLAVSSSGTDINDGSLSVTS